MKMLDADMEDFQTELRETGEYDFLGARKVTKERKGISLSMCVYMYIYVVYIYICWCI
jgi:hypothetical protein